MIAIESKPQPGLFGFLAAMLCSSSEIRDKGEGEGEGEVFFPYIPPAPLSPQQFTTQLCKDDTFCHKKLFLLGNQLIAFAIDPSSGKWQPPLVFSFKDFHSLCCVNNILGLAQKCVKKLQILN